MDRRRSKLGKSLTLAVAIAAAQAVAFGGAAADTLVAVDQGWNDQQKTRWYEATQGSRLIPLEWLQALEQPGTDKLFLDDAYIAGFRYLPRTNGAGIRLPLGFTIDTGDDSDLSVTKLRWRSPQSATEPWVGMNCSACHTTEVTYQGNRMRIDGGTTLADFQSFIDALDAALKATRDDPAKWDRFAKRVLRENDTEANRKLLQASLASLTQWQLALAKLNETPLRYGFARLDAFGHIFNKISLVVGGAAQTPNPADAPTSYPFLWNVVQHDKVEWNGIAPNSPKISGIGGQPVHLGALARNTSEAIGVFADITVRKNAGTGGYKSSIDVQNLIALEQQLGTLLPPAWPDAVLGTPKPELVDRGRQVYADHHCGDCHTLLSRTDLDSPVEAKMGFFSGPESPDTDPWMACNAYTYTALPSILVGTRKGYVRGGFYGNDAAPVAELLGTVVAGALVAKVGEIATSTAASFFGVNRPPRIARPEAALAATEELVASPALSDERELRLARCLTEKSNVLGYKARPLTGIWATAPYLHNGSVPTLYDLLLPPDQRPKKFHLGTREFDPEKVGYLTEPSPENSFEFDVEDASGQPIPGNQNTGHDYGNAGMSDTDRVALVEFLKTL